MHAIPKTSLLELLKISFPLMLTALSGTLMFFLDRVILAHYAADAMNAAANVGTTCAIFQFGGLAVTAIAEVFVGQFNGSKQYTKLAVPVWQMLWVAVGLSFVFIPLALWGGPYIVNKNLAYYGLPYFKILMFFSALMPMVAAVSSFFIGQGKVKQITIAAAIANILNLFLNWIMVFGVKGLIPSMGIRGSAYATVIAEGVQFAILFAIFLNKSNRRQYHTHIIKFDFKMMKDCLRLGIPPGFSHMIEMTAWLTISNMLVNINGTYLILQTIGTNIFVLFTFFTDGLHKGVMAISSNLIGANKWDLIPKLLKSSFRLHFIVMGILFIPLIIFPECIINLFIIDHMGSANDAHNTLSAVNTSELAHYSTVVLKFVWLYCVFDGLIWVMSGVLTSGGDTIFIMTINILCVWLLAVLPTFYTIYNQECTPYTTWLVGDIYTIFNFAFLFIRYKTGKWKKMVLAKQSYAGAINGK